MKVVLPVAVIVIVIGAVGFGFFSRQVDVDSTQSSDLVAQKGDGVKIGDEAVGTRYVEYSREKLNNAANSRRVLFFYASWCPTCRPADASFRQNEGLIPSDVTLIRVNYNDGDTDQEEKELAVKYQVTYQHTFVQIDGNGNLVTKWNGGEIEELLTNIR